MSIKSKLQRMKGHLKTEKQADNQDAADELKDKKNNGEKNDKRDTPKKGSDLPEKWGKLDFQPFDFEGETSFQRKVYYPFAGENKTLKSDMESVHAWWNNMETEHPLSSRDVPLERMMFFDTETTGLSTGAGNSIFLIGYARLLEEGIEVTQHILGDPASEAAFMYGFLREFSQDDYLVSYNGKSFDWPQVKSRHAFVRERVPKLPAFGHIDLLHAARRLWKHELPSCRLSIVEQEKLSVRRENDTPGSMAPLLYFDYLNEKDPEILSGIIEHNDQDVRSLIKLYAEISKRLNLTYKEGMTAMEHLQIGHWFEQTGSPSRALVHYEKAAGLSGPGREKAYYRIGLLLKKEGDINNAKENFLRALAVSSTPFPDSWTELAKIAEHQEKNFSDAYQYSRQALEQLKSSSRLTGSVKKQIEAAEKRVSRLAGKLEGKR
ncbi:ribonuclease H-like domain-containing protein [Evansella sp. LMS18]|uniref:ribonuclease H-like domain-containing protein n=1 Tax=Evansella sp. LMS18 TaxID=2924033 RepID=UPI0020D009EC|nr:ribonuclease H-like domain-containing protein [Evansella sp. LMS18]UTR10691.1 ribonuclease H-like domain-containing protein [Evansella sp. LMS18]